jgi:transcriptional regulator NrdR family protein
MQCPKCEGEGADERHIENLGGKRKYPGFDTRRYECKVCSFRFMTVEKYLRTVETRSPEE